MANADARVVGLVGGSGLLLGVAIARGRRWLLANYDPDAVDDERRVARLAGGALVAFGLLTFVLAGGLQTGQAGDSWWAGWTAVALGVAVGVAAVASGRR